jgi:hypothetical protein
MGAHATLFKSYPAIVTIGFHSANFKQVSVMPSLPSIICTLNASTTMHGYTSYHKRQHFFLQRFSASLSMTAQSILILIATNMMHSNNQCQHSNFCLKTSFFCKSLNYWTNNGLAMINDATMPLQITEKPSCNTTASTKALMVQNRYQE